LRPHLRCMMRNTMPRSIHSEPTTRYAMPRNGFFPPNHDVVVRIMLLVPLNTCTGYTGIEEWVYVLKHSQLFKLMEIELKIQVKIVIRFII